MALTSPGVEVTIIDQSQYLPAPTGTVPLVVFATAQNKANPAGIGVAQGTTAANANKLFQITSQRDLVTLYGTPFFYTTTNGTPIQGYELNEYGLLAAYSVLGATNRLYALRADIDLGSLVGKTGRPTGNVADGTYWLDTTNSTWGLYEWNATTQLFVNKTPIVISDSTKMSGDVPTQTIGAPGDYAVVAYQITDYTSSNVSPKKYFYKNSENMWVDLYSSEWQMSWPTIQSTLSNPALVTGSFTITINEASQVTITIGGGDTVYDVSMQINDLGYTYLTSNVVSGRLCIYSAGNLVSNLVIASGTTGLLTALGIPAGQYYMPVVVYGTASQMPLWKTGQTYPASNGSVWIKIAQPGNGQYPIVSKYNATAQVFRSQPVIQSTSSVFAIANSIDPTGGKLIPAGTIIQSSVNYSVEEQTLDGSLIATNDLFVFNSTGITSIVGSSDVTISPGGILNVQVTLPNSNDPSQSYYITIPGGSSSTDFVTLWGQANIPYTLAELNTDMSVTLSHTLGGMIQLDDTVGTVQFTGSLSGTTLTVTGVTTGYISNGNIRHPGQGSPIIITEQTSGVPGGVGTYTVNLSSTVASTTFFQVLPTITFVGSITGTTLTVTSTAGYILNGSIRYSGQSSPIIITGQLSGTGGGVGTYTVSPSSTVASTTFSQGLSSYGTSSGILSDLGFIPDSTTNFITSSVPTKLVYNIAPNSTSGLGTAAEFILDSQGGYVTVTGIPQNGIDYAVGDIVTFNGTVFNGTNPQNNIVFTVTNVNGAGGITQVQYVSGNVPSIFPSLVTKLVPLDFIANEGEPYNSPANGTNWFYSVVNQVDIMVNTSNGWSGYNLVNFDSSGFPNPSGSPDTDPNGPLVSPTEPTTQSDGSALVYGDLWIDTSDLELYPLINRWESVNNIDKWVLVDNTDQVTSRGVLFADARWATNGDTNPSNDPIPTITSLLTSDYLDLDAPSTSLYPVGMLLFNTRRSGYNVKQYIVNYFNNARFPDQQLPTITDAWVSASGLQANGAAYMGRKAQRNMVVMALREAIDTNTDIRDEDNQLNLIATPNYPEVQQNMVLLNNDRGNTGYILGDTPLGLPDSATAIQAWATNAAGATSTGEEGCVTRDTYLGLFYPSGLASDLSGNLVAVPPSHMMLRTFVRNDTIAYPWFAAAGVRRGTIDNATNIGYLNRTTGEFITSKTRIGIRDVLYTNFINPLVFFTGNGLLNYGNKTSYNSQSALDRTNVARLIAYIRRQLTIAARPFVFEPNDSITRKQIQGVIQSLMIDLVAKRGIYDYIVICDESNNTPSRIDRNELWVDVAIEPVKAAEFIYIPVRVLNTGAIAAL